MATVLGTLAVKLEADTRQFNQDMQKANTALAEVGRVAKTTSVALGAASLAIAGGLAVAVRAAGQFESGMIRVGAIAGASEGEFRQLTKSALDLASATVFTAREVASGMQLLAQAGFDVNEIIGATPAVLNLATAAGTGLATAANIISGTMRGFGKEVSDLTDVSDVLTKTFTSSNTDLTDLGEAFKLAGPVAKAAGLEFNEVAAVLGQMANANFKASLAGTAMRGAISRLLNPSKEISTTLKALGVNVTDSDGRLKSFTNILKQLEPHADDAGAILKIFGQRAGPALAAVLQQGGVALDELREKIDNAAGATQALVDKQLNSLEGQLKILNAQIERASIEIGSILTPAVRKATAVVQDLVQAFLDLSPETKTIIAQIAVLSAAALGLGAVIGATIAVIAILGPTLLIAAIPVAAIAAAILVLVAVFGIVETAITVIKKLWAQSWTDMLRDVVGFVGDVLSVLSPLQNIPGIGQVLQLSEVAVSAGQSALGEKEGGAESAFEGVSIGGILSTGLDTLLSPLGINAENVGSALSDMGDLMAASSDGVTESFTGVAESGKTLSKRLEETGKDLDVVFDFSKLTAAATQELEIEFTEMTASIDEALALEARTFDFSGAFSDLDLSEVSSSIEETVNTEVNGMMSSFEAAMQAASDSIRQAAIGAGMSLTSAMGVAGELINAAVEGFSKGGIWGAIFAVIAEVLTNLESFTDMVAIVNADLGDLFEALDPLMAAFKPVTEAMSKGLKPLFEALGKLFGALGGIIKDSFGPLKIIMFVLKAFAIVFEILALVFEAVGEVLSFIGVAIENIFKLILGVWNAILGAIASVFDAIGNIELFGKKPFKFLNDWADTVRDGQMTFEDFNSTLDGTDEAAGGLEDCMSNACSATDGFSDDLTDLGDTMGDVNQELSNMPSGFKLARAQFGAANADPFTPLGGVPFGAGSTGTQIGTLNIGTDAQSFLDMLNGVTTFEEFVENATTETSAAPFAVPAEGS